MAVEKAKSAAAFSTTYVYLQEAYQLLQEDAVDYWPTHYDLLLALATETAEAAYLVGKFTEAEQLIAVVLRQATSLLDIAPVYEIKMQAYIAQNKMEEACQIGLQILAQLGEHFPPEPTAADLQLALAQTQTRVQEKSSAELLHLPEIIDPEKLVTLYFALPDKCILIFYKFKIIPTCLTKAC